MVFWLVGWLNSQSVIQAVSQSVRDWIDKKQNFLYRCNVSIVRSLLYVVRFYGSMFQLINIHINIQGCIQKFQDSTCKKKFAHLGC